MYLQIKTIEKVTDKYAYHFKITKVGLYDDEGNWIKWAKLNDNLMEALKNAQIDVGDF